MSALGDMVLPLSSFIPFSHLHVFSFDVLATLITFVFYMATLNTVDSSFSCMIEGKSFKLPFIEGRVFLGRVKEPLLILTVIDISRLISSFISLIYIVLKSVYLEALENCFKQNKLSHETNDLGYRF